MTAATVTADEINAQIANTILCQIGGAGRVRAMIGAEQFIRGDRALLFRFKAKAVNKANRIKITLDDTDTYTVEFGRIWGTKFKVIATTSGIYADGLKKFIEDKTGLRLSLGF